MIARYWTVAQKNGAEIPLTGVLLWNRLLWLGVGVVVTLAGYAAFRMQAVTSRASRRASARRARGGGRGGGGRGTAAGRFRSRRSTAAHPRTRG